MEKNSKAKKLQAHELAIGVVLGSHSKRNSRVLIKIIKSKAKR